MGEKQDFRVFAENVRGYRQSLGWSNERLAAESGVGLRTLIRIQQGHPCFHRTQLSISLALRIGLDTLWNPAKNIQKSYFIFREPEERWCFANRGDAENWTMNSDPHRVDPDSIQQAAERDRLGRNGLSMGFAQYYRSYLPGGMQATFMQNVYSKQTFAFPPTVSGICIYCIKGSLKVFLGDDTFELHTGDVLVFEAHIPYSHEPLSPLLPHETPPAFLGVTINRVGKP